MARSTTATTAQKIATPPIKKPKTPDKLGVSQLLLGFVMALVAMLVFAILADQIYNQEAFVLDAVANPFLHSISSPAMDLLMNGITTLGSVPFVAALFVGSVIFFLYRGYRSEALFLTAAIGGAVLLNSLMKVFVHRPRPALPWAHVLPDYSFPSGHSMNSLVFYLSVALIIRAVYGPRAGSIAVPLALLIALAVGLSRIYLGYHYLSDVVGGFAAGLGWLFIVLIAFEAIPRTWARRPWAHRRTGPGKAAS
ncbi:MAG TPA: phosphatase PAP2 family protein [Candidatus Limnocylindrales bacterium]|jgi:undecaprenyl-diphosphatase|nr:phosphatase PAP2 family protein [Candidatus Limnocylindrales bacterium]